MRLLEVNSQAEIGLALGRVQGGQEQGGEEAHHHDDRVHLVKGQVLQSRVLEQEEVQVGVDGG